MAAINFSSDDSLDMKIFWRLVDNGATKPDALAGELKQPIAEVLSSLQQLQKIRFVETLPGGLWCVTAEYRKRKMHS